MDKQYFANVYGYHIVDEYILTPIGISDYQCTFFEMDEVYGDWTLNGKEYYLNLNDLLPVLNDKTGFHRV